MSWEEVPVQNPPNWLHFTDFNETIQSNDLSQSCQTANISDLISFSSRIENSYESLHSQNKRRAIAVPENQEPQLVIAKIYDSIEQMKIEQQTKFPLEPKVEIFNKGNPLNDISMESEYEQLSVHDFIEKIMKRKKELSSIYSNEHIYNSVDVLNKKNLKFTPIRTSTLCNTCENSSKILNNQTEDNNKFVVNLFESRNSKKWKRKRIQCDDLNENISFINKPTNVNNVNNNNFDDKVRPLT